MATTAIIQVRDANPVAAVQDFLELVLTRGDVEAVLAPRHLPARGAVMPALIADPAQMRQVDPLAPSFPMNAAKLLAKLTRGESTGRVAAVLRPCEIRAFIELVKLNQGSMEEVLLIGVDCLGACANPIYHELVKSAEPMELSRDFVTGATQVDLARACQVCEHPAPIEADLVIGLIGCDTATALPVISRTVKGEALLRNLELPDAAEPASRQTAIDQLVARRTQARDAMFEETAQAVSSLAGFAEYLSGCVNCYNCRVACPVCYCRECVFVTDVFDHKPWQYLGWAKQKGMLKMPTDTLFYHLTRLAHMSTACVGCGQCSNACPNDIPVMELFRTVAARTQAAFDYMAGRSVEEAPPLAVFHEHEFSELTGGKD